jgi:ferric-dicitrate binding protein FerR (iron transport regulator)
MTSATAPSDAKALSAVSKKWDVDNKGFLTEEERALRNLDVKGPGALTSKQLSALAEQCGALRKENKQLKRGLVGLALLAGMLLTVLLFVGTVAAVKASTDTATDRETGVMLATGTDSPVPVNTNEF